MSGENFPVNNVNTDGGASANAGGDTEVTNIVNNAEKKPNNKRLARRALAAVMAIASLAGAGCSKNKKDGKESRQPETKHTMATMDPSAVVTETPNTISTGDVTISTGEFTDPTFETKKQGDLPEILKADPEYGNHCEIYNQDNTEVKPTFDLEDYLYTEAPTDGAPVSPKGHFNLTKFCEDLGIDSSSIHVVGSGKTIIGDTNGMAVEFSDDYKLTYYYNGAPICVYDSRGTTAIKKDGISFHAENSESGKCEFASNLHCNDTTMGVLELMLCALRDGRANPFKQ